MISGPTIAIMLQLIGKKDRGDEYRAQQSLQIIHTHQSISFLA